jgi:hypothetical protein
MFTTRTVIAMRNKAIGNTVQMPAMIVGYKKSSLVL